MKDLKETLASSRDDKDLEFEKMKMKMEDLIEQHDDDIEDIKRKNSREKDIALHQKQLEHEELNKTMKHQIQDQLEVLIIFLWGNYKYMIKSPLEILM